MAKDVRIIGSVIVAGGVRYAYQNPLKVTDQVAVRLKAAGVLAGEPTTPNGSSSNGSGETGALDEPWIGEAGSHPDADGDGVPDDFEGQTVVTAGP